MFDVEVPTHVSARSRSSSSGGVSQSVFSFDSPLARTGIVEITGTEGTLIIPDPNLFTGEVKITRAPTYEAIRQGGAVGERAVTGALAGRGTGVLDLARCVRTGSSLCLRRTRLPRPRHPDGHRRAVTTGHTVDVDSTVDPVPLVADDWDPFATTL